MVLHKQVNGIRIQLPPDEEAKVRAEWSKNDVVQQKQQDLEALISQIPSIDERIKAIEECLFEMIDSKKFKFENELLYILKKCRDLDPQIELAKTALKETEKANGS